MLVNMAQRRAITEGVYYDEDEELQIDLNNLKDDESTAQDEYAMDDSD